MAIQGKYLYGNSDLTDVYSIRELVLYRELGQKQEYLTETEKDKISVLGLVYSCEDNKAVATGRMIYDGESYIIDQILVLKEERNKYYGDFVIRLLITKAFMSGADTVIAHVRKESIGIFEKIGFLQEWEDEEHNQVHLSIKQEKMCKKCNI